jgi:hypothetical protein
MLSVCGDKGLQCRTPALCALQLVQSCILSVFEIADYGIFPFLILVNGSKKAHDMKLSFRCLISICVYSYEGSIFCAELVLFQDGIRPERTDTGPGSQANE